MADFEALLKSVVEDVNSRFDAARNDLEETARRLNNAVTHLSEEDSQVILLTRANWASGSVFSLSVKVAPKRYEEVLTVMLPIAGYPMVTGEWDGVRGAFKSTDSRTFANREDLENFLAEQLTSPDSRLVQYVAFAIRQARDADVPF